MLTKKAQAAVAVIILGLAGALAAQTPAPALRLEFRELKTPEELRVLKERGETVKSAAIPPAAVRVWGYEGTPVATKVNADTIAVDYGRSGVLFERGTGAVRQRWTLLDGWPEQRPAEFPAAGPAPAFKLSFVGPGVLAVSRYRHVEVAAFAPAAECTFNGQLWRAMQPADFMDTVRKRGYSRKPEDKVMLSWTGILTELNKVSFLEAWPAGAQPPEPAVAPAERTPSAPAPVRGTPPADGPKPAVFTTREGLASNIITHLAAGGGKLWAACVDIYDPDKKDWGPGGLCWFDPAAKRWQRLDKIDGRPVRWVTLLQAVGDELWVGFREGRGIEDEAIYYGMSMSAGTYRPTATSVVLARLAGGKWTSWARPPIPEWEDKSRPAPPAAARKESPTEAPHSMIVSGDQVFLFSVSRARYFGDFGTLSEGHISLLTPAGGTWRVFDTRADLEALRLSRMEADNGTLLAYTDRGLHRWLDKEQKWAFLDSRSPVVNPTFSAAAVVGNELWVGYNMQSFGVRGRQGISRFNEETLAWSYLDPKEIGTDQPIRGMAAGKDEVWVHLGVREHGGAAAEMSAYYGDEAGLRSAPPGSLARFVKGKWQFPALPEGVPASVERSRKGPNGVEKWQDGLWARQLFRLGERTYLACNMGVYVGPGQWKPIVEGSVDLIQPAEDGASLEIIRRSDKPTPAGAMEQVQVGLYDPATAKLEWREVEPAKLAGRHAPGDLLGLHSGLPTFGMRYGRPREEAGGPWAQVPTKQAGAWAVGPLPGYLHSVVATPWAVWIACDGGELFRLERTPLAEWLEK